MSIAPKVAFTTKEEEEAPIRSNMHLYSNDITLTKLFIQWQWFRSIFGELFNPFKTLKCFVYLVVECRSFRTNSLSFAFNLIFSRLSCRTACRCRYAKLTNFSWASVLWGHHRFMNKFMWTFYIILCFIVFRSPCVSSRCLLCYTVLSKSRRFFDSRR